MPPRPTSKEEHQFIAGYHAVRESLLHRPGSIEEVWLAEGKDTARSREIVTLAGKTEVPVRMQPPAYIRRFLPHTTHQGIVALGKSYPYADLSQMIDRCREAQTPGLLLVGDHITDEGNLGAIIRTGAFFGAHGLILPKDRSARVTPQVIKRSSGAHTRLPVARVVNLGRTLDLITQRNFWIIGTSGRGSDAIYNVEWDRDVAVILGSEHKGVGPSLLQRCHQVVRIPSPGDVESLNVAVACGVILSEIFRYRTAHSRVRGNGLK